MPMHSAPLNPRADLLLVVMKEGAFTMPRSGDQVNQVVRLSLTTGKSVSGLMKYSPLVIREDEFLGLQWPDDILRSDNHLNALQDFLVRKRLRENVVGAKLPG